MSPEQDAPEVLRLERWAGPQFMGPLTSTWGLLIVVVGSQVRLSISNIVGPSGGPQDSTLLPLQEKAL